MNIDLQYETIIEVYKDTKYEPSPKTLIGDILKWTTSDNAAAERASASKFLSRESDETQILKSLGYDEISTMSTASEGFPDLPNSQMTIIVFEKDHASKRMTNNNEFMKVGNSQNAFSVSPASAILALPSQICIEKTAPHIFPKVTSTVVLSVFGTRTITHSSYWIKTLTLTDLCCPIPTNVAHETCEDCGCIKTQFVWVTLTLTSTSHPITITTAIMTTFTRIVTVTTCEHHHCHHHPNYCRCPAEEESEENFDGNSDISNVIDNEISSTNSKVNEREVDSVCQYGTFVLLNIPKFWEDAKEVCANIGMKLADVDQGTFLEALETTRRCSAFSPWINSWNGDLCDGGTAFQRISDTGVISTLPKDSKHVVMCT